MPGYQSWLESLPSEVLYRYHLRLLKQLQVGRPPRTWLLKAPSHLLSIDGLLATYPDARVIQTVRAPETVVASIASLTQHLYTAFGRVTSGELIGELGVAPCGRVPPSAWRDSAQRIRILPVVDVDYERLRADPMAVVRNIYDVFGLAVAPAYRAKNVATTSTPTRKAGTAHIAIAFRISG